jgi:hypothetical protein
LATAVKKGVLNLPPGGQFRKNSSFVPKLFHKVQNCTISMNLSSIQADLVIFAEILAYLPLRTRIPQCCASAFPLVHHYRVVLAWGF